MGSSKPIQDHIAALARRTPVAVTVSVPNPLNPAGPLSTAIILKPGLSTSEGRAAALSIGVGILMGISGALQMIPGPWAIVGAGIMISLTSMGYSQSRGAVKTAAINTLSLTQPTAMVEPPA